MSPELTEIVLLFFGGIAISSFWLLINLVASYHPYHNPALPFFSVFISGAIAIFITAALSENISTIEATRIALTNGVGTIRVSSLGLSTGDPVRIKFGYKYFTGVAEYTTTIA